ncbi:MAG: hypothetical protein NZO16_04740 [Deltaproteobacteria bacterium]|nr:hypothetical protein [Deltaproteobacteria bacterium]
MSIDWLLDLEKSLELGREFYAVQGVSRGQWILSKDKDMLITHAKTLANQKGIPVSVYKLASKNEAALGCFFLVPTRIEEAGPKGEPQILWTLVETKDAAELVRDLRHGASPYFAAFEVEVMHPSSPQKT